MSGRGERPVGPASRPPVPGRSRSGVSGPPRCGTASQCRTWYG